MTSTASGVRLSEKRRAAPGPAPRGGRPLPARPRSPRGCRRNRPAGTRTGPGRAGMPGRGRGRPAAASGWRRARSWTAAPGAARGGRLSSSAAAAGGEVRAGRRRAPPAFAGAPGLRGGGRAAGTPGAGVGGAAARAGTAWWSAPWKERAATVWARRARRLPGGPRSAPARPPHAPGLGRGISGAHIAPASTPRALRSGTPLPSSVLPSFRGQGPCRLSSGDSGGRSTRSLAPAGGGAAAPPHAGAATGRPRPPGRPSTAGANP